MTIKGELFIIKFPSKKGREQEGIRPGIIIADTKTDLILVIPLTSNLEASKKFSYTFIIKKSEENNLEKDSVALVFQLQALDKKRLIKKIGSLEDQYLKRIDNELKILLKL